MCPDERPFSNGIVCLSMDPATVKLAQKRSQLLVILGTVGPLFLLLLVTAACCFGFRRKFQMVKQLVMPPIPLDDLMAHNPQAKPNMARLTLIKETEVRRGVRIGEGAFGAVYKGMWLPESNETMRTPVAVKEVSALSGGAEAEMLEEAALMASIQHQHLVPLHGICISKRIMIVTPLMPLGNLLEYVQNNRSHVGSFVLLLWSRQIASGMEYLEQRRLVHRDLAARNVLIQNPHHVRVSDFGLAKMLDPGEREIFVEGRVPIKWLALECIRHRRFTSKSDVWAFGVTVWELLEFGGRPYHHLPIDHIPDALERGERLAQPSICSMDIYMTLIQCWVVDAESRPSFRELKERFADWIKDPPRYLNIPNEKFSRAPRTETSVEAPRRVAERSSTDSPLSPTSPTAGWPLISRIVNRSSTNSHKYQPDPLRSFGPQKTTYNTDSTWLSEESTELPGLASPVDQQNYVVPDSQLMSGPSLYTPVVHHTSNSRAYYNVAEGGGNATESGNVKVESETTV